MVLSRNQFDLVIVGAGAIGLSVARAARAHGLSVAVLERGTAGRGASWAAAGMLSPLGEALEPGPFLRFGLHSLDLWPDFARGLAEETGEEVEYRECGKLRLALSEREEERLRGRLAWAREHDVPAQWLEAEEVRRGHPGLAPVVRGALFLGRDFRVDNRRLVHALRVACVNQGVQLFEGCEVTTLLTADDRVHGVQLSTGEGVGAGRVLVAAGAWSGQVAGLPRPLPVRPIRGEMAALRPASPGGVASPQGGGLHPLGGPVLESERLYLVPRDDGRILVGATETDTGFDPGPTVGGLRRILAEASAMVPALEAALVEEVWSGFRPGSPDGMPILGQIPGVRDLFVATGHYRNGILLTPATAEGMGKLVAGEDARHLPEAFLPDRFFGPDDGSH